MSDTPRRCSLVLVTQFFRPETGAGARRATALAEALAEEFDVQVLTLEPGYPESARYDRAAWEAGDAGAPYPITRRPVFRPHDTSLVRRALREIAMSRDLVAQLRGRSPDIFMVSTPSMFLAPLVWLAARTSGKRFVWDLRDLTWRYARESAPTGGAMRVLLGALEGFMLWLLRRADIVIAATEGLANVIEEQGVRRERLMVVTNGVSRAFLSRFAATEACAKNARPRITYVGLIGYNHGIGILLDVAREMPEADFCLVGDGPERAAIEARVMAEGLTHVTLHGYVTDVDELARIYRESDVLVNHTRGTPTLDRIVYPAKTYEYFATGRPVVYAGAGYAAKQFRKYDLCAVVPPGDSAQLARGIREVLAAPEAAAARARCARRVAEEGYCREELMRDLAEALRVRFGSPR